MLPAASPSAAARRTAKKADLPSFVALPGADTQSRRSSTISRQSPHAAILLPSRGVGVGAAGRPFNEYQRRPGERHGLGWLIGRNVDRAGRYVRFDSNHWQTLVREPLAAALGDVGSLTLYGHDVDTHRYVAEQVTA